MVKIRKRKVKKSRVRPGLQTEADNGIDDVDALRPNDGTSDVDGADDGLASGKNRRRKIGEEGDEDGFDVKKKKQSLRTTDIGIQGQLEGGAGDGFGESDQQRRQEIEDYLKGTLRADAKRREELRFQGIPDQFDPKTPPQTVETWGEIRAADHMIRLYDNWMLAGDTHEVVAQKAADFLIQFENRTLVRKVLKGLENKPIRDIYPLEVIEKVHAQRADMKNLISEKIFTRDGEMNEPIALEAGQSHILKIPHANTRITNFAMMDGARPGYAFEPGPAADEYSIKIFSPGEYRMRVRAVDFKRLGQLVKEQSGGMVDELHFHVTEAPYVPPVISNTKAEQLRPAGPLSEQIQESLDGIHRDDDRKGKATYAWRLDLKTPGQVGVGGELNSFELQQTEATDEIWQQMIDAVNSVLQSHEPSSERLTIDDIRVAIRRARAK